MNRDVKEAAVWCFVTGIENQLADLRGVTGPYDYVQCVTPARRAAVCLRDAITSYEREVGEVPPDGTFDVVDRYFCAYDGEVGHLGGANEEHRLLYSLASLALDELEGTHDR